MIKNTVAPIPIELLKEYFSDDSIIFNIDYAKSILKSEKLITYISNLDVPCQLTGWDKVSTVDKFAFVKDYMNAKLVIKNYELESCVLKILCEASDTMFYKQYESEDILTDDEVKSFCADNEDLINRWLTIIASFSIFVLTTVPDLVEEMGSIRDQFQVIDNYDFCGVNFVQLLRHELTQDLIIEDRPVYYFEKQFNEPMFKGHALYKYWNTEANTMAIITMGISSGDILYDEFQSAIEEGLEDVSAI